MKKSINHISNITMPILISEKLEGDSFSNLYARKLVISQINSQEAYEEIDEFFDKIKNCETFYVNNFSIDTKGQRLKL